MTEPQAIAPDIPRLPFSFARKWGVLISPDACDDHHLTVYHQDDVVSTTLVELQRFYERPLCLVKIARDEFTQKLQSIYTDSATQASELMDDLGNSMDLERLADALPEPEELMDSQDDAPIIRLINALVSEAIRKNSSDIHIEPLEDRLRVRMRIDGMLQVALEPPKTLAPFLISRIKVMSHLDIAEKRLPQDGRISLKIASRPVDIRVSTIPGAHGERIVLRILDKQASKLSLSELGMQQADRDKIEHTINQPHGIFLVTGPTGSGKTTTLYAALSRLNASNRNIMTVEDPIEYYLDGIAQTQVNRKVDMSFARGLRAILRQDPDVVMVGEIRDQETAEIAVQASLTGHLVLSTLHTNTAIGAVTRLRDIGVQPYLIASSLLATAAQRLVRILCEECKSPRTLNDAEKQWFAALPSIPENVFIANGCPHCAMTGYTGRQGIFELIQVDEALRSMISNDIPESEIARSLTEKIHNIHQNGLFMAAQGTTSIEEVMRVTHYH